MRDRRLEAEGSLRAITGWYTPVPKCEGPGAPEKWLRDGRLEAAQGSLRANEGGTPRSPSARDRGHPRSGCATDGSKPKAA